MGNIILGLVGNFNRQDVIIESGFLPTKWAIDRDAAYLVANASTRNVADILKRSVLEKGATWNGIHVGHLDDAWLDTIFHFRFFWS